MNQELVLNEILNHLKELKPTTKSKPIIKLLQELENQHKIQEEKLEVQINQLKMENQRLNHL
jgi:hypothetical protein